MNTESGTSQNRNPPSLSTVAQPVPVQPAPLIPISTGTLGHAGVVEYSKSVTAIVSETYVVATKK